MSSEENKAMSNKRFKMLAQEMAAHAADIIEHDKTKEGILLCEGTKDSIDVALYSAVYPYFVVMPANGCVEIRKLVRYMKSCSEYPAFGIIDRDNCSKQELRIMQREENVYCTKLPFIENIICCPEVLKIITKQYGIDYPSVLKEVRLGLADILVEKLSLLNPFNVNLPPDKEVEMVSITIVTKTDVVYKRIDLSNVMYTFRNKAIVGKVADAMGMHGKDEYYRFMKKQLSGEMRDKLVYTMSKYLPNIQVKEL